MRNVMIATPAYDGTVDVRYTDALVQTIRMAPPDVGIYPVFLPGDAIVQRARNSLCKMALEAFEGRGVDDLVFIDADISWNPQDFFRLLSHPVDVVAGLYRQTQEAQTLVFRPKVGSLPNDKGLLEVEGIGCGFMRISITALAKLWKSSRPYSDGPAKVHSVFEITMEHGELLSEDIAMCHKWRSLKGRVYLDPAIACIHIGTKIFRIEPMSIENQLGK